MQYIFFRKSIRNDYHCPSCRLYTYTEASECLVDGSKLDDLKAGKVVWEDEW